MDTIQESAGVYLREKNVEGILLDPDDPIDVHPAALKFRELTGHLDTLGSSLQTHGQLTDATVIVIDGKPVLCDGLSRRQLLAEKGLPLRCRCLDVADLGERSVEEWILENNLHGNTSRHLTDTQRALQAAVFVASVRRAAKERIKAGKAAQSGEAGRTEEHLARIAGCKPSRVRQAIELKKKADERLVDAVWSGKVALSKALEIVDLVDEAARRAAVAAAAAGDRSRVKTLLHGSILDGERQPIPQTLLHVFAETALIDKACKHVDDALDLLRKLTAPQIDLNRVRAIANTLQEQKPYCVCPYCAGTHDDCRVCENNRWLTASRLTAARNEDITQRRRGRS